MLSHKFIPTICLFGFALSAYGTTPVITVTSPAAGSTVGSPVNYVASASSPSCSKGISAMRIYTAPGVNAYTVDASSLNANVNLTTGSYSTVVQAWDNCGGVGKTAVNISVSKINYPPPKFLYATEYTAGKIAGYTVNPLTGSITPTAQGTVAAHADPVDIASDLDGYRLYVTNQGSNDLSAYFIYRNTGELVPVPGSPFALAGPGDNVVVHPTGDFVYASSENRGGTEDITAFAVQSNGSLKTVPGSPFMIPGSTAIPALAMDPEGEYLYASSSSGNVGAVAAFIIDKVSGALTPVSGSPFVVPVGACNPSADSCQSGATDLAIAPSGKYLYAVLGIESAVAAWAIDRTTGTLSDLAGSPYPEQSPEGDFCPFDAFGACPDSWTESIDPQGKFIYVADSQFNDLSIFTLNESTGVPSYSGRSGNTTGGICVPYTVDVDPSGTFVYSLGITSNDCKPSSNAVLGFSINQRNGQLNSVPGSPFANSNVHTTKVSQEKVVVTR
jgi:6-phosphogluconolactonase